MRIYCDARAGEAGLSEVSIIEDDIRHQVTSDPAHTRDVRHPACNRRFVLTAGTAGRLLASC